MIQFYAPDILSDPTLPEDESAHCCRVLRMKEGDKIYVVNGKGSRFECVITEAHSRHTSVEIVGELSSERHWKGRITLAVAPTKNIDRIEWLLEKVVEIGIDQIVLIRCEHSERKNVKMERLEKIIVSAMKQSLKFHLPELKGLVDLKDFLASDIRGKKYMGYCDEKIERREFVKELKPGEDVTVLVGPEGDFSPEEVGQAIDAGFFPVTFGESRLRTETAALYAVEAVHIIDDLYK